MTTNNSKNITEQIYHTLNKFFGGQFHFGIHSEENGIYTEWCRTVAWLMGDTNHLRNAEITDLAFCRLKNAEGKDVYVRPNFDVEDHYVLFDDLTPEQANRYSRKPGTLTISSSPGKIQVWFHSDRILSIEEKKVLIHNAKADEKATPNNRWGRCPGFANYKPKYAPKFPLSRFINSVEGLATLPKVEVVETAPVVRTYTSTIQPSKTVNIRRSRYATNDESQTDFKYVLALLHFGVSEDEIVARVMTERTNWENKSKRESEQEKYIRNTIRNARKYL